MSPPFAGISARLRFLLGTKLALAVGLNLFALLPYYFLQRHGLFPVKLVPATVIDDWIPFNDQLVWLYLSLFLLMPVTPMQMIRRSQLWRYAIGVAAMSLLADFFFFFWPTTVERPPSRETNEIYRLLNTFVLPNNAAPSLHVAMAVFSALCFEQIAANVRRAYAWRMILWTWALAILHATLATKQHLALDAIAGVLLGLISYAIAFKNMRAFDSEVEVQSTSVG